MSTTANTKKTTKPKPRGKSWPKGTSGNPAGRPKDGESWSAIIKAVGEMYSDDLLAFIGKDNDLGREINKYPKNVQLKYLVTARVFASIMFDPNPRMWSELMNRAEGKVPDKMVHEGTLNVDGLQAILKKVYGNDPTDNISRD